MRGRLHDFGYSRDGESLLTIASREDIGNVWDEMNGCDIEFTVKKFRDKRGLSSNGLYWSTLAQLAHKLGVSNAYMHNVMIRRYGQPERFEDQVVYIMLPDTEDAENKALEAETYHLKPTSQTKPGKDGQTYRAYMLMRGSSTYTTEEFSRLLDGLLSECKEAGIHVMTNRGE